MGVELGKNPLRAALDVNAEVEPEPEAVERGRIARGEVGVLDARKEAPFAPAPVEAERALDEEEAAGIGNAGAGGPAAVVGLGAVRRGGVVDGVDGGGLGGIGRGGHGEIRVAAGLLEDAQFIAHAAMRARGVGIVERPVPMDETEADCAGLRSVESRPWPARSRFPFSSVVARFSAVSFL